MPRLDGLIIKRSTIHGYGMYALRPFRKGDIVVVGDGVLYTEDDEFDDEYALVLPACGDETYEQTPVYYDLTDQTRWVNHSCLPNTEVDCKWDLDTRTVVPWWYAVRDIEPGDEVLYDYAFIGELALPCSCGSANCRGVIVDPDELDLVPRKYRHLISPTLLTKAAS